MPYIQVIQYPEAEGPLKEIYDELIKKRGKLAEIHKIQSLNPKSIVAHMDLYLHIMFGKSPLRRYQREMLGVIVSISNDCKYCVRHHAEALDFFWKDTEKMENFIQNFQSIGLTEADTKLCEYAKSLTRDPNHSGRKMEIAHLKNIGLSDRAILDATLIISYFNFVNRIVLGLGVNLETDGGSGYRYD